MERVYSQDDFDRARKQKRRMLMLYLGVLAVFLAANTVVFAFQTRETQIGMGALNILLTTIIGWFTLFYFSVFYRKVRAKNRLYTHMQKGLSDKVRGKFLRFEGEQEKDGVEGSVFFIEVPSIKRGEVVMERKILVDKDKTAPDFKEGQYIFLRTHAGFLTEYGTEGGGADAATAKEG